jgi:predicted adenylyl cyclase CyaB
VQSLGYRPTAIVTKRRAIHKFERDGFALEVCCDEVETLGRFVEIEIVAPPEKKPQAEAALQAVARDLGLTNLERRSYLQMALSKGPT